MLGQIKTAALWIVTALVGFQAANAETPSSSNQVQVSLDELHQWLGEGANGERWKRFLDSERLTAELAKGTTADREALAAILAKYSSSQAGLNQPRFVAVKSALAALFADLVQEPANLAAAAREAQKNFAPVSVQEAAKAKVELASAMRELEAWLNRSGAANAAAWKKYLGWSELENVVAQDEPPAASVTSKLLSKLTANQRGLEMQPFVRTRAALEGYVNLAVAAADTMLQEHASQQLDALATRLEAYEKNPGSGDDALAIGDALGWLASSRQAAALQAAIRRKYGHPNFYASASERFAAAGIEQGVDRTTGVRDNILGTDIHGTARLTGRTTMALLENPRAATFNILLGGAAYSNNLGYNGPVTIYTTGVTSVSGTKQLQMTADGLVGYRAGANCRTHTTINGICAKCGLIEKIAWRRAGQQKAQAEAIASDHAAARVAAQMDAEAIDLIANQNERYVERFKKPLQRRGAFPSDLTFSSTAERAFIRMSQDAPDRLAAPGAPPEHDAMHDVAVRVHESLAVNFGEAALGGVELTDVRLEKLIRDDLKAELPEELRVTLADGTLDPDKEPWSIIFAKQLPVRARFQDGGLWMAIRAEGFTRGEGDEPGAYKPAITELVEISAAYSIERTDAGATLRRDGDVKVRFPSRENPDQITVRDNAIVTFIRRKFRSLFKEEFAGQGIKLKDRWAKAGTLKLAELNSSGAWLTLGWNMQQDQPPAAE
jgi:hypothetical protein